MKRLCDDFSEKLSVFIDGGLDAETTAAIDDHLRECERCSDELSRLDSMVEELRALPEEPVPEGLWTRIEGSLGREKAPAGGRSLWISLAERLESLWKGEGTPLWRPALAAAVSLIVIAAVVSQMTPTGRVQGPLPRERMLAQAIEEVRAAELHYIKAIESLEAISAARVDSLPEGIAVELEANLKVIDEMIVTCGNALGDYPANQRLQAHLLGAYSRKISMLEKISGIEI